MCHHHIITTTFTPLSPTVSSPHSATSTIPPLLHFHQMCHHHTQPHPPYHLYSTSTKCVFTTLNYIHHQHPYITTTKCLSDTLNRVHHHPFSTSSKCVITTSTTSTSTTTTTFTPLPPNVASPNSTHQPPPPLLHFHQMCPHHIHCHLLYLTSTKCVVITLNRIHHSTFSPLSANVSSPHSITSTIPPLLHFHQMCHHQTQPHPSYQLYLSSTTCVIAALIHIHHNHPSNCVFTTLDHIHNTNFTSLLPNGSSPHSTTSTIPPLLPFHQMCHHHTQPPPNLLSPHSIASITTILTQLLANVPSLHPPCLPPPHPQ